MNTKYVAKHNFVVMFAHSEPQLSRKCNFQRRSGRDRIIWGILLICIIGAVEGCSPADVNHSEINQVNMKNSEIDGEWFGVMDGMDGKPLEVNYRFKAEGTRLLGLIKSQLGGGPISEGKIDGKNIEFKLNAGEDLVIINNGTLSGDEIQLTETIGKEKIKVVLKRVKQ